MDIGADLHVVESVVTCADFFLPNIIEGSLEVKLPTIWRDGKAEVGRVTEEKTRDGESQKREDAGARKGRKVAIHCVLPMICGSGGPKSNLAKTEGAEPSGQMRDEKVHAVVAQSTFASQKCHKTHGLRPLLEVEMLEKCTPLWCEAHFQVKLYKTQMWKTHHVRTTFGS